MPVSRDLIERCQKARSYFLEEKWAEVADPNEFSSLRLRLAALTAELGAHLPEAEKAVSFAKKTREEMYLKHKKSGEKMSDKECEALAKMDAFEQLWAAEYNRDELKYLYEGFKEILNSLASKISTLQAQARGQI